jgi:hypothetical protein
MRGSDGWSEAWAWGCGGANIIGRGGGDAQESEAEACEEWSCTACAMPEQAGHYSACAPISAIHEGHGYCR